MSGLFIGVGVGPGDPELLTLKAYRAIQNADVICYLENESGHSQALTIAVEALKDPIKDQQFLTVSFAMSRERIAANRAYDKAIGQIQAQLKLGKSVAFLCEGDPLFFGSFTYLLERLDSEYASQVIPGIPAFIAATAQLQMPLTVLKQSFAVITGRHEDQKIRAALLEHDAVVIMKAGIERPRLIKLLKETQRFDDANYLEYISRDNQKVITDLTQLEDKAGPYFSLFVITRPEKKTGELIL
ncbi:precorrin-2 C(20)-methyltransferase [Psychromonas sp. Urea-02u-13]|uniref:precorrin-2 C(20)-methyltransferase n=1 Tax=Psychromonas sp. Urea-02u-13 TaxID=2058326 RepID=UPI000C331B07|nr:precorrin-2 C(20)-methyltransferase [Psychromonas sp. Urea-02u-13]PKG40956.1 precorrin-2 C(20)-methyltransferase [Psychromonas sp. Urea-02u-13]